MTADEWLAELVRTTAKSEPETDHHRRIIDKVWEEIVKPALAPESSILDIGAGSGYALEIFAREGHVPIGINYVPEDADACRKRGKLNLTCLEREMHDLPGYFGGKADLVWARHVLEHSPFPMLALREFKRVLKPRGLLYVEVPAGGTDCHHEVNPSHFSIFSQEAWSWLLRRSGFEVLEGRQLSFRTLAGDDVYYLWLCKKVD